jgi:hypothetical protein
VHLGVMSQPRVIPVRAVHCLRPVQLQVAANRGAYLRGVGQIDLVADGLGFGAAHWGTSCWCRVMAAADVLFRKPKPAGNMRPASSLSSQAISPDRNWTQRMKDFANASFSPDLIKAMDEALEGAVATLPHPVSSTHVQRIAESILRSAKQGESDPRTLQTMALVEMLLRSGET